jgi:formylmethanofuran dehydrogenase subunit E
MKLNLSESDADLLNDILYGIKNDRIQKIRVRLVKTIRKHRIESIRCENCGKNTKIFYTEKINGHKMDCCTVCAKQQDLNV